MWLPECPDKTATLRQGDLLSGLMLPRLTPPFNYARPRGRDASGADTVLLVQQKHVDFLVVSQCCTIENQGAVALAPVTTTPPLTTEQTAAYLQREPGSSPDVGYARNHHVLDPYGDKLVPVGKRLHIADLTQIQTYICKKAQETLVEMQAARLATMTPAGRRLLRIRLMTFWGQVESEDNDWFLQNGLPPSFAPSPAPVADGTTAVAASASTVPAPRQQEDEPVPPPAA